MDPFERQLRDAFDEMVTLLLKKRAAYGPHNLVRFGGVGIVIRASDKIERLGAMYRNGATASADGDSMEDAWRDLIGYGVLGLLHHREERPPEDDPPAAIAALGPTVVPEIKTLTVGDLIALLELSEAMWFTVRNEEKREYGGCLRTADNVSIDFGWHRYLRMSVLGLICELGSATKDAAVWAESYDGNSLDYAIVDVWRPGGEAVIETKLVGKRPYGRLKWGRT